MTRALLILGPTAGGKTALALALAERLNGEIVNADSMQVYRDLRVLTARPTAEEEALHPHHLFGAVDAAERFSVGHWLRAAAPVIESIRARGATPIIVGGTGLYFKALTEGLAEAPEPDPALTASLREALTQEGPHPLYARLQEVDAPAAARLMPGDGVRIVRALAVRLSTGRSLLAWREEAQSPPVLEPGSWLGLALTPPRAALYDRIAQRFAAMLEGGALQEAEALAARRLDPTLPAMKAHGAPWLMAHLAGALPLDEAERRSVQDTRHYAKRQFTWIAHQAQAFARIPALAAEEQIDCAKELLRG